MRNAILRRNEDHRRGTDVRRIHAVVTCCAGRDLAISALADVVNRGLLDRVDAVVGEGDGRTPPDRFDIHGASVLLGERVTGVPHHFRHLVQLLIAWVFNVDVCAF